MQSDDEKALLARLLAGGLSQDVASDVARKTMEGRGAEGGQALASPSELAQPKEIDAARPKASRAKKPKAAAPGPELSNSQLTLFEIAPWKDSERALGNDFMRSGAFTIKNKREPRAALQNHKLFHLSDEVTITFTGIELRADDDELILLQVLEYAKRIPLGEPVYFTFYELCRDVGWSINGRYYEKAEECLSRLQASALGFYSPRIGRLDSLSLVSRFRVLDRGTRQARCEVQIDRELVQLFAGDYYTRVAWDQYRELSPTARRLYDYAASHASPWPLPIVKFRMLCGSDSGRLHKWREQVRQAVSELGESGLLQKVWLGDDDSIHFLR